MGLKPQYPIVVAGETRGPKVHKMAFEGFLTRILQWAKGLKPNTPLLRLAEPEGLRCTKWHLRGSLLVFLQLRWL
ncbi:Hypothetical protein FKW44_011139 [Caligus rogercresseyi]|uniref:Uncharacterized protein n=1 Tax=Caligus rogercresseyi TaxID=217165 RepID=A0A7T8HHW2_CALRO|nr:Hypothetical protein FKW44_011139 [Caligus rogercresseyi]